MTSNGKGWPRHWVTAAGAAVLVVVAAVLVVSLRPARKAPPVAPKPAADRPAGESPEIKLTRLVQTGGDNLMSDEARFFDPTPLFLPTEWNADQNALPASVLNEPGRMFQDFPSRMVFQEGGVGLEFPGTVRLPARPGDVLTAAEADAPYFGMGRSDLAVPALAARGGYLEVTASDNGRSVLAEPLTGAKPPVAFWRPLEMLAAVNAAGLVGRLSFIERSGVEEVDNYFQNYLVKSLNLGQRLPPGFYRISVGP